MKRLLQCFLGIPEAASLRLWMVLKMPESIQKTPPPQAEQSVMVKAQRMKSDRKGSDSGSVC